MNHFPESLPVPCLEKASLILKVEAASLEVEKSLALIAGGWLLLLQNIEAGSVFLEFSGERGIRTLGTVARTTVFETVPIDHSGTSPVFQNGWERKDKRELRKNGSCVPPFMPNF